MHALPRFWRYELSACSSLNSFMWYIIIYINFIISKFNIILVVLNYKRGSKHIVQKYWPYLNLHCVICRHRFVSCCCDDQNIIFLSKKCLVLHMSGTFWTYVHQGDIVEKIYTQLLWYNIILKICLCNNCKFK